MFEVNRYIGKAYLHHITEHPKYLKLSTCNLGKCSFFFETSSVIVLQKNQFWAFPNFVLQKIRKTLFIKAITLSCKNAYKEKCYFSKVTQNRV